MGQYDDARRSIESSRSRMTAIAEELSHRTSSEYIGGRAKEVARMRAENARRSPRLLGALGALAGGAIGMALARSQRGRGEQPYRRSFGYGGFRDTGYGVEGFRTRSTWVSRERTPAPSWESRGYPYGGPDYEAAPEVSAYEGWRGEGAEEGVSEKAQEKAQEMRERAGEAAQGLKERAGDIRERVSHKAADLKEKAAERSGHMKERGFAARDTMKERASHLRERVPSREEFRQRSSEHPLGTILGFFLIGAAAAAIFPLTNREQRLMHPARERATSQLGSRLRSFEERVESVIGGEEGGASGARSRDFQPDVSYSEYSEEAEEPYRQPDFAEVSSEADQDETFH